MGNLITLRREAMNLPAFRTPTAETVVAGNFNLGEDNLLLIMRLKFKGTLIIERVTILGVSLKFLLYSFIDMVGFIPTAALLADRVHPIVMPL